MVRVHVHRVYLVVLIDYEKKKSLCSKACAKKRVSEANVFFLQTNLKTRVTYFSAIDQNNKINCLLHFRSCFYFELSHSAIVISYQNRSRQCMNLRRRGLV